MLRIAVLRTGVRRTPRALSRKGRGKEGAHRSCPRRASSISDLNDRLAGQGLFRVLVRFVDALERIEGGELVEWKAALQMQIDQLRNGHVGHAVAFDDAVNGFG